MIHLYTIRCIIFTTSTFSKSNHVSYLQFCFNKTIQPIYGLIFSDYTTQSYYLILHIFHTNNISCTDPSKVSREIIHLNKTCI